MTNPPHDPERDDLEAVLQRAIELDETMRERPCERIVEAIRAHAPSLRDALERAPRDERWARASLMLQNTRGLGERDPDAIKYLRRAKALKLSEATDRWVDVALAAALGNIGQKEAAGKILARLEQHEGDETLRAHVLKIRAKLALLSHDDELLRRVAEEGFDRSMARAAFYFATHFALYRVLALMRSGEAEAARVVAQEGIELCRVGLGGEVFTTWSFDLFLADIHTMERRYERALTYAEQCYKTAQARGWQRRLGAVLAAYTSTLLMLGRFEDAKRLLAERALLPEAIHAEENAVWSFFDTLARAMTEGLGHDELMRRAHAFAESDHEAYRFLALLLMHALGVARQEPFPEYVAHHSVSRSAWRAVGDVLRGEEDDGEGAESFNGLERALLKAARSCSLPTLRVQGDFEHIALGRHAPWVDIRRRRVLRRILRALSDAAPKSLDAWRLFEIIWPNERAKDFDALNRLYTALHRARDLGLEGILETVESGYRLRAVIDFQEEG